MKYKVKQVHFVGIGGAATSKKQGPVTFFVTGCDWPRVAPAADRKSVSSRDNLR